MSREFLQEIARGEITATELGLPEPAPYFIELSETEYIDGKPTPERLRKSLDITLARVMTERWNWGIQWGQFIALINPCKPRPAHATVLADDCHIVAVREPEK